MYELGGNDCEPRPQPAFLCGKHESFCVDEPCVTLQCGIHILAGRDWIYLLCILAAVLCSLAVRRPQACLMQLPSSTFCHSATIDPWLKK